MTEPSGRPPDAARRTGLGAVVRPILIILSIAVSILIGLKAKGVAGALAPAGSIYLFLLEMTVIPIIISAIVSGIARLVAQTGLLRGVAKLAGAFVLMSALVGLVGVGVGAVGRPGTGISAADQAQLSGVISSSSGSSDLAVSLSAPPQPRQATTIPELLTRIVPRNIFASLSEGRIFQIALFSIFFGLAVALLREKQQGLLFGVAEGTLRAFTAINTWLIYLLPLGIICLLSKQIAMTSGTVVGPMLRFVELFVLAAFVVILFALLLVWGRSGRRLWTVVRALFEPSAYAFITGESLVTMPYAMRALTRGLRFRRETVYFAQPLLSVAGSFGSLLFFVLAGIFVAQFYGSQLTFASYATLLVAATLSAAGTSARLGAAPAALLSFVLIPLGLPVEAGVAIFGALGVIIRPLLALVDVNTSLAAVTLCIERPEAARARSLRAAGGARPHRGISIRASLVILIGSLIILTGSVLIGLLYSGEKRSIYGLADTMIKAISARAEQRTLNYFSPAERSVRRMQYLIENHLVSASDRPVLLSVLHEEVRDNPEFASAYFADASGNFSMVKRMPDGSLSYRIISRTDKNVVVHWQHSNPAYSAQFPDSTDSLAQGYDPRSRGWYQDAAKSGKLIWTDVYLFASDNTLGISTAIPIQDSKGRLEGVLAVDIGLAELSYFLGTLDVSKTGKVFILNNKRELVALSTPAGKNLSALFSGPVANGATSPANLVLADEASDPVIRSAFAAYLLSPKKDAFFSFTSKGERYLSMFSAFPDNRYFPWTMAIAVPEELVMGDVNRTNRIVWYTSVLIVIVAIGLGVNFSRAITFPLRRLSQEMERIRNFDLLGEEQLVSRISEIHKMNESFVNMKHGLR
ncbi:MAG TPA: cation:dicarboxylase symporter family transporter, partial [Spirochaetia bacterium]|nr:cation:dicarboxylase symporter family transporter [Spirochaetia bacterium]